MEGQRTAAVDIAYLDSIVKWTGVPKEELLYEQGQRQMEIHDRQRHRTWHVERESYHCQQTMFFGNTFFIDELQMEIRSQKSYSKGVVTVLFGKL
jgi:hypothetical protein